MGSLLVTWADPGNSQASLDLSIGLQALGRAHRHGNRIQVLVTA